MKPKTKTAFILLFIITSNFFPTFAKGQIIHTVYPSKDACVTTVFPNDNINDEGMLWISSWGTKGYAIAQAYAYFKLPFDYSNYDTIKLGFDIFLGNHETAFNISIYWISQNWSETTISWNNKPSLGEFILNAQVGGGIANIFNVKKFISSGIFSICIIAEESQENYGSIPSNDYEYASHKDQRLALTLLNVKAIIILSIVGIIALLGSSVIGFYLYKRKRAKIKS